MNLVSEDPYEIAKAAFVAGTEYAERELGGSIPLVEVEEAFNLWLDDQG